MSSDGEISKNQQSEVCDEGDTKANLDATDSSQDSIGVKSETEDEKEKPVEDIKEKDNKPADPVKTEEKTTNDNAKQNDNDKKEKNDVEAKNSKEEKDEEKSDEESEGAENSGDEDGDDDKKEVPLLDQPLEQSGTRERKKVQRFNEDFPLEAKEDSKETSPRTSSKVDIPSGTGTQLGDIPRIDASISRFKTEDLKLLHKVLFKTPGKTAIIKKNIKKFNGFDFKKDSDTYAKKVASISKMEIKQLKSICEMLDLEKSGKREEIGERICEFLLEPKDSGKPVGGGRPKRTAAVRANNRGYSSHDDDDDSDSGSKRASRSRRGKGKRINLKEESSSESDAEFNPSEESDEEKPRVNKAKKRSARGAPKKQESEEDVSDVEETVSSDDSEEPKSKRKRGSVVKTPNNKSKKPAAKNAKASAKKTPAANKKKTETKKTPGKKRGKEESDEEEDEKENSENNEESSSGDDEPLVKKSKSPQPPTDDEIKTYVKQILEGANLEEITMKTVCKQVYAHYPEFDLAHKKDFIKTTVKSLIST